MGPPETPGRTDMDRGASLSVAHPDGPAYLLLWFPPSADFTSELPRAVAWPYAIAKWMLTLLALAGWLRLRNLAAPAAQWIAVVLLTFPLIYYVVDRKSVG